MSARRGEGGGVVGWWGGGGLFFQAEDGIRDLVRSRGLGDVYKRQGELGHDAVNDFAAGGLEDFASGLGHGLVTSSVTAVSYTHLTLPTSDLV